MSGTAASRPWQVSKEEQAVQRKKGFEEKEDRSDRRPCELKVVLRVRPGPKEDPSNPSVVDCEPRLGGSITINRNEPLTFARAVLGPDANQRDVFVECGKPMLDAALNGQPSCLFAYGQTGAGTPDSESWAPVVFWGFSVAFVWQAKPSRCLAQRVAGKRAKAAATLLQPPPPDPWT